MTSAAAIRLDRASIAQLRAALRDGQVTASALFEQAAANHQARGAYLNGYRHWDQAGAQSLAAAADAVLQAGCDTGPLLGLPLAVKDVFGARGMPMYGGTARSFAEPWSQEGPIVSGWRNQVGVITGKAHSVEFALGVVGTNPNTASPRNPWDAQNHRVCGGSTSGAGPILHEGSAVLVLGTDGGGSIRVPASLTGCVGLRTSLDRLPTGGGLALAPSLETPGLLARTVGDLIEGYAGTDPQMAHLAGRSASQPAADLTGMTIGVADQLYWRDCGEGVAEAVLDALKQLERAGARLVDLPIPAAELAVEFSRIGGLTVPEVYYGVTTHFPDRIEAMDPNVWGRLSSLGNISASEYLHRKAVVRDLVTRVNQLFDEVDLIAMPTTPITAPTLSEVAQLDAYRACNVLMSRNTYLANLADTPAISIVAGLDGRGLPVGLQLSGRQGSDEALLLAAWQAEAVLGTAARQIGYPPLPQPQ
ncbi:MAG TPA: amidase [Devosia sp.]|nr:amidase [Devosia sp.]